MSAQAGKVLKYSDSADRDLVSYGAYTPGADQTFEAQNFPVGGILEPSSAKLHLEEILARYATIANDGKIVREYVQSHLSRHAPRQPGIVITPLAARRSNRDVKVGDRVLVTTGSGNVSTRITGLVADVVAPVASLRMTNDAGNETTQAYSRSRDRRRYEIDGPRQ